MELANQRPGIREDVLNGLMLQVWEHYQFVLGLFDTAIGKIGSDTDVIPPSSPDSVTPGGSNTNPVSGGAPSSPLVYVHEAPLSLPFTSPNHDFSESPEDAGRGFLKRRSEDYPDDQREAKRDSSPFDALPQTPTRKNNLYVKLRTPKPWTKRAYNGHQPSPLARKADQNSEEDQTVQPDVLHSE
ncbi:hypothetical protein EST38_g12405 [Candolleomyces aberdarensis]|uniref:Uncharacterized protein n=1 Tax=Candolleomyces aberdarensis TaxID=2316362 RepID=A0A4Q2D2I6_9AGAR|nr:hypothetical protein EST38_g12405 [Candolleomyces aberdarensis]